MCFPFPVSLNGTLDFVVSRNHLVKEVLKPAYTWESVCAKTGVVEVPLYCCQGGYTFNPEPPSHSPTLRVAVAHVNSPATGRMWCIYTLAVIVPATTLKYSQWYTHAQIFCRNSWVTPSYANLSVTKCKWKTQEARLSLNLSELCREPVLLLCSPLSSTYSSGCLAWSHEHHVKSLWILTVPALRIDDSFFSFSILWIT